MSVWKKKENLIISGFVLLFFAGLIVWFDLCCVKASFFSNTSSPFEVAFKDQNDKSLTLDSFKGKPIIVNLWATWCPVCVKKMGTLNRFAEKFQAKGGQVVAISQDRGGLNTVRSYFTRNNYDNLAIYVDPSGQLLEAFDGRGLPTSIFIDAQGNELGRISGGIDWESPKVEQLIREYFNIDIS